MKIMSYTSEQNLLLIIIMYLLKIIVLITLNNSFFGLMMVFLLILDLFGKKIVKYAKIDGPRFKPSFKCV